LIIFLGAPLAAIIAGYDNDPTLWLRVIMAALFLIFLLTKGKYRFHFPKTSPIKIVIDILLTIALCVVMPIALHAIRGFPVFEVTDNSTVITFDIPYVWFFFFFSAAVSEEPLFRGILWGFLKNKGMKDLWICVIQAALFWAGHIYYIGTGVNFWIVHPLAALVLGLIVWKSKSITHSMVLHSSMNTFMDYLRFVPYL
jgi:membrane protease YdiL (CAAX protease family)